MNKDYRDATIFLIVVAIVTVIALAHRIYS